MHNSFISIIVVVHNMSREAPRTLRSLAVGYQHKMKEGEYEVIVIDNGSDSPLGPDVVHSFGPQYSYYYLPDPHPSPAEAVNFGVQQSQGDILGIIIDGARILTPGVLHQTRLVFKAFENPIVATLGWHLGPDIQQKSVARGYNSNIEDELLKSISWPEDGYELFCISTLGLSSRRGLWAAPSESNVVFLKKQLFESIGGMDVRFDLPGGGLLNLDFFKRVCEREDTELVLLIGEGNFHQIHGGVSTNSGNFVNSGFQEWNRQYKEIRGTFWSDVKGEPYLFGTTKTQILQHFSETALSELKLQNAEKIYASYSAK